MARPWVSNQTAQDILVYVQYSYPIILLFFFLIATTTYAILTAASEDELLPPDPDQTGPGGKPLPRTLSPGAKKRSEQTIDFSPARKLFFSWLSVAAILTFLGDSILIIVHALVDSKDHWWCGQAGVIYVAGSFFVYLLFLISIIDTKPSPTAVHFSTWIVGFMMELILLGASLAIYTSKHREPRAGDHGNGRLRKGVTSWEVLQITVTVLRILFLFALVFLYALFAVLRWSKTKPRRSAEHGEPAETTGLLNGHAAENGNSETQDYGGTQEQAKPDPSKEEDPGWVRKAKVPTKSWWEYIRGYSLFFPYLWPSRSLRLQISFLLCVILVAAQRGVNVLVPYQAGRITDTLAGDPGTETTKASSGTMPWLQIFLFIFYRFLQGTSGLLGAARAVLWIPISQYSYRELSTASFEHVHGLSLEFHLGKKTGEIISALSKGNSINTFLEQVTFQLGPMMVDLAVAFVYFLVKFDAYFALVIAIVTCVYIYATIRLAQWRVNVRRDMTNFDRHQEAVKNDSLVSYESVKYFNAEKYEFKRFSGAVGDFQRCEATLLMSLNLMNIVQNFVFTLGLIITCFIAAYQVSIGQRPVGDFVALLTYMAQLQAPLNFFGTFYRSIQMAMINSERLLELFKEKPTVVDSPDAQDLPSCQGEVRFNDVKFSYDPRKPALNGLTFQCKPGTSTALVGESGGGKSTVFRLLFRFYNLGAGSIQVDGHDVEDVTIDSLRRHIGVVPQDTVLFNETLMYNLKYARPSATDDEVYEACRAASIHDRIEGFPDGYNTKVGERGLKLSGGEKQRVAIARTILKDPRIILLDEATAALDTETEQHIQVALNKLSQGRTTIVIAHRLSTITTANQILVLHQGRVEESGTHLELLEKKGKYASMWKKQIRAQQVAEQAKELSDKAARLQKEVRGDDSASQSEDERQSRNERGRAARGAVASGAEDDSAAGPSMPHGHP
ncbi:ATP-binding cassette-type vacuolar membrane transporter Hmt1 [Lecanora helva]